MGLQHGGARSDHFAPFAPKIAGSADLLQPALHGGEIRRAWQSALAGGVSRAIHIEDQVVCSLTIPQPTRLFLFHQRPYLVQCYDRKDFPRTNNDMERSIRGLK